MVNESRLAELYGEIANKMDEMIPCEWKRIVMYAEEIENVSSVGFYFYTSDSKIHWSDGIPEEYGVNEAEHLMQVFELAGINKEIWAEFKNADEPVWSIFTFDLDRDWKFKVKFGYERNTKISDIARQVRWAYDELGIVPAGEYGRELLKEYLDEQGRELPDELLG